MSKPTPFLDYPAADRLPFGPYMAYMDRATDGDTVVVSMDLGFEHYPTVSIRLRGLHAPESHQLGGPELTALIEQAAPYGTHCVVYSEKTPRSQQQKRSFERYVGDVILEGGRDLAQLVNQEIVRLQAQSGINFPRAD